jgi:hypothetical protein
MNDNNKSASVFTQYIAESLKEERTPPTTKAQKHPAQKLLDWLQRWNKPTVSWRDIHNHGPRPIRDRKSAIDAAEILVRNGWLVPLKPHRYDMHKWQIVRRPPIVAPEVSM